MKKQIKYPSQDLMADVDPNEGWEKEEQPSPSSTVERTPGEWEVWESSVNAPQGHHLFIHAKYKGTICRMEGKDGRIINETQANAAYICKAVNVHEELVEELKAAYAEIRAWRNGLNNRNMNKCKVGATFTSETQLKSALQKASQ